MPKLFLSTLAAAGVAISSMLLVAPANAATPPPIAAKANGDDIHPFTFTNKTKYKLKLAKLDGNCPNGYQGAYPNGVNALQPWDGAADTGDTMTYGITYYVFGCGSKDLGNHPEVTFDAIDPSTGKLAGWITVESEVRFFGGEDRVNWIKTNVPGLSGGGVGEYTHTPWVSQL